MIVCLLNGSFYDQIKVLLTGLAFAYKQLLVVMHMGHCDGPDCISISSHLRILFPNLLL